MWMLHTCNVGVRAYVTQVMRYSHFGRIGLSVTGRVQKVVAKLKVCSNERDLLTGRKVHSEAVRSGKDLDLFVASSLINMYTKCRRLSDARSLFDSMISPGTVPLTSLMAGYTANGLPQQALLLFQFTQHEPDVQTLLAALKSCTSLAIMEEGTRIHQQLVKLASLEAGLDIHSQAVKSGLENESYVATSLVNMYTKCGSLLDARRVFDRMVSHGIVTWNALILGCVETGEEEIALSLFSAMSLVKPDAWTYAAALKACVPLARKKQQQSIDGKLEVLGRAMEMHAGCAKSGFVPDVFVVSKLINLYMLCGSVYDARSVFDRNPGHNIVVWNSLLMGYVDNDEPELTLELLSCMDLSKADSCTFMSALKACGGLAAKEAWTNVDGKPNKACSLEKGRNIYRQCEDYGCHGNIVLRNILLEFFVKCGSLTEARRVFDRLPARNLVSWNSLMLGFAEQGAGKSVLELFSGLPLGCLPSGQTYVAALKACTRLALKEVGKLVNGRAVKVEAYTKGKDIHSQAAKAGVVDMFVSNTLLDMYMKCGKVDDARKMFETMPGSCVISWTVMILGYAENCEEEAALELFEQMQRGGCIEPNSLSFGAVLKACSNLARKGMPCIEKGMVIHSLAAQAGMESDSLISNSLVDMYAKCGYVVYAKHQFDELSHQSLVSWTTLMFSYVDNGDGELALETFCNMKALGGFEPDVPAYVATLKAAGILSNAVVVKRLHSEIVQSGMEVEIVLQTCLVDAYGKCGKPMEGENVVDSMLLVDTSTMNALIGGYARKGESQRVFALLDGSAKADGITLANVLMACNHGGQVEEGRHIFELMNTKFGVRPRAEHYVCLVDLLGRASRLDDALEVVTRMPCEDNVVAWRALLGSCHRLKNPTIGMVAYESLLRLDARDAAGHVLMANILS